LDHLRRSDGDVEWHPLRPFLPAKAQVLFLGSFPPPRRRWCMDFFYPNFINDHWRILGLVFFGDKNWFVDEAAKTFRLPEIVAFLEREGIGYFDTATAVRRLADNASDKFLEVVEPTDVARLVEPLEALRAIVTTGEKACQTLCASLGAEQAPRVGESGPLPGLGKGGGVRLFRLPSSSRAYPLSFERKAAAYRAMFQQLGMVP